MELYCIKTHSQRAVIAGNVYPLISDQNPCKCPNIDVGIKCNFSTPFTKCTKCGTRYPTDNIHCLNRVQKGTMQRRYIVQRIS